MASERSAGGAGPGVGVGAGRPRPGRGLLAGVLVAAGMLAVAWAGGQADAPAPGGGTGHGPDRAVSPADPAPRTAPTTAPAGAAVAKPTGPTESCVTEVCHGSIVNRKVMHGPVAQIKCDACHLDDEPREHRFKLAVSPEKLCDSCHVLQHRTTVHAPIRDGQCAECHDPHGSEHRLMLKADPAGPGLCQGCHADEPFVGKKFQHGPVAVGACILCHEAHSSWAPKLLVKPAEQLCQTCHGEVLKGVAGGGSAADPTAGGETARLAEAARHVHEPVKTDCGGCHDPHASDQKFQLVASTPRLCLTCHEDVTKEIASAKVVHGPARGPGQAGHDDAPDPGGCMDCHTAHVSQLPKLQKSAQPAACLSCHDNNRLKDARGRPLTDMAALLKDNPEHHGPIREGSCTVCHQPHAGDRFNLLRGDYPPEFYAPFKIEQYALCFDCHVPQLVLEEKGAGLTRFRDGERNLHWLHVNREKGRTCRACHEVHASKRPFHVRESVPFGDGGWMLEVRFEKTETGGTCTPGCHVRRDYDRGADPRPAPAGRVPGPGASRSDGADPIQTGAFG